MNLSQMLNLKALKPIILNFSIIKLIRVNLGTKVWEEVNADNFHDIKIGDAISGEGIVMSKGGENTLNCLDLYEESN